jgi:hypothetical protein
MRGSPMSGGRRVFPGASLIKLSYVALNADTERWASGDPLRGSTARSLRFGPVVSRAPDQARASRGVRPSGDIRR